MSTNKEYFENMRKEMISEGKIPKDTDFNIFIHSMYSVYVTTCHAIGMKNSGIMPVSEWLNSELDYGEAHE